MTCHTRDKLNSQGQGNHSTNASEPIGPATKAKCLSICLTFKARDMPKPETTAASRYEITTYVFSAAILKSRLADFDGRQLQVEADCYTAK